MNAMRDPNTATNGTKSANDPKLEMPQAVRDRVEKGTAQAREAYDKVSDATAEASQVIQGAFSTSAQNVAACNAKVIEFARANTNAALDYAGELLTVKSPSDLLKLASEHTRRQFEALSAQSKELAELSQKVMTDAVEPLKTAAGKAFRGPHA
jgi:phasin